MRILSVDGGGIRGLMPSLVLHWLEQLTGVAICELFDLIVGTSTGAMIACMLATPGPVPGRPKFSTADLLRVYRQECVAVFSPSRWKNISSAYGIYGERFSTKLRDELFRAYLGDARLSTTVVPVVLSAFELDRRQPKFFKTSAARRDPARCDHGLADVLGAALAAPTVFPPHALDGRKYMDALFLKNPTLAGLAEALKHGGAQLGDVRVLSLGTGYVCDDPPAPPPLSGIGYLLETFNATVNANTVSTQYIAEQLLGDRCVRIDFGLPEKHLSICDVSKENLARLEAEAERAFRASVPQLSALLHQLHPAAAAAFDGNIEAQRAAQVPLPESDPLTGL